MVCEYCVRIASYYDESVLLTVDIINVIKDIDFLLYLIPIDYYFLTNSLIYCVGQAPKVSTTTSGQVNISSILKSDNALNYSQKEKVGSRSGESNNSLATVSIVSSLHSHSQPPEIPQNDSLVVSQVFKFDLVQY